MALKSLVERLKMGDMTPHQPALPSGRSLQRTGPACLFLRCKWFGFCIALLAVLASGCATSKSARFTPVDAPPDKALIYFYWRYHWIAATPDLTIHVDDGRPEWIQVMLPRNGYYPLILSPGTVTLGYSIPILTTLGSLPCVDNNALRLPLEAGKTYYVSYQPWGGWKPKLVLMEAAEATNALPHCKLGKLVE